MDDRTALMAAIIANPDEDTPRLALADWLQEHGDKHDQARAEFIRLQIAVARLPEQDVNRKQLAKRAKALHTKHAQRWLGHLEPIRNQYTERAFDRGLLFLWHTSAGNFLKVPHQKAVCEMFPLLGVKRLGLADSTKRVKAVADSQALAWITEFLWLDAKLEDDGFEALAGSPHTAPLSRFVIDKPRCSDKGLKAFAKSKSYPNLRTFGLRDGLWRGNFTAAGVRALLESTRFPKLDELDLSGAHKSSVKSRSLFSCPALSRLRVLRVGFDTDLTALSACPHLTNLEELYVEESTLLDADAQSLATNPAFERLKVIELTELNANQRPLGPSTEKVLRDRFGSRLVLEHSILSRP